MKLFLTSANITPELKTIFVELVGKPLLEIKFALIENAADPYNEEKRGFVYDTRAVLESLGMDLKRLDLREYVDGKKNIFDDLKKFDVVWVGGGNTFYLRWIFKESGFDVAVPKLISEGLVYAGGSAGSVIMCPSLEKYDIVDDSTKSPEIIKEGLGLIDVQIVPHWGYEKYQTKLEEVKEYYYGLGKKVVTLTDDQAFIVNQNDQNIVPPMKL